MNTDDVVAILDQIDGDDFEAAHGMADSLLLMLAPIEVQDAVKRLQSRCSSWVCA